MRGDATRRGLRADPLHPWRTENLGRLLLASVINWQDVLVLGLQAKGFRSFRASHMNLLRHLDFGGTRISEIARRSRLTKQTVGELLAGCEAEKLVKTVPDPTDARAKIVTFTRLGKAVIEAEREVMERIDAALARELGPREYQRLRRALAVLAEGSGPFLGRRRRQRPAAAPNMRSR